MRNLLLRCYPARWQARYGDEFEAILDEAPLGPFDVADILLGALDARLRRRGQSTDIVQRREFFMSLRIGGIAATVAALIWTVLGFATGSQQGQPFGGGVAILAFAGLLALLVAVTGLSAFQARSHPKLIWTAFALIAAGTVAMAAGAAADLADVVAAGWNVVLVAFGGLAALLGSALFGLATFRNSTLSRQAAALLVAGPATGALALMVAPVALDLAYLVMFPAVICLLAGWFALGVSAIRLDRVTSAPRPA
ncbi:MAG: hypothetical protein ABI628_12015 [Chloroflexota bacterium]